MSSCLSSGAAGDLLAGWHFNGLPSPVESAITANHGSGWLDLSGFVGASLGWQTGTDLNAWPGDGAGEGLGFTGTSANGKSAILVVNTMGYSDLSLSMAVRATATGHMSSVVEAWTGGDWTGVGSFNLTAGVWATRTFDLSAFSFLNDGTAIVRVRLEGATSSQGNFRIDNLRLEGTVVPAPGALLLAGAGLTAGRRRRRE